MTSDRNQFDRIASAYCSAFIEAKNSNDQLAMERILTDITGNDLAVIESLINAFNDAKEIFESTDTSLGAAGENSESIENWLVKYGD